MSCDPKTLLESAKCLCLDERQYKLISVTLSCTWAAAGGGGTPTTAILTEGSDPITTELGDILVTE